MISQNLPEFLDRLESLDSKKTDEEKQKIFKKLQLDWLNAYAPKGFDGVLKTFNAQGYGIIFIDGKGIVRGTDLHAKDVERLMEKR